MREVHHRRSVQMAGEDGQFTARLSECVASGLRMGTPSPQRGEGWGEGARTYEKILGFRTPSPSLAIARSTSPLWGEVKVGPFAPPLQRTPFPSGEREKCALIDAAVPIRNTPFGVM